MKDYINSEINKAIETFQLISQDQVLLQEVENIAQACVEALNRGNKILFAGNGGSAADAQHLAAELVSRFSFDRPGLAGIALTTDTSAITAIGNDYGYDKLFARQLEAIGKAGDVLFAISTSGKSPNVMNGVKKAKEMQIKVVGLTGMAGGDMPAYCDLILKIPSSQTPKIQEGHILLGHIICGLIEKSIFGHKEC